MHKALQLHLKELKTTTKISEKELEAIISKFELLANTGIQSHAIFYILNLNSLSYEYINEVSKTFTGKEPVEFLEKGLSILPEVIVSEDFKALSNILFPKMNACAASLLHEEKTTIVFEFHYRMIHCETKKETPIVEYSSYSNFEEKGNPTISTGICYESVLDFNGVRGIVRVTQNSKQITLFDETVNHTINVLTKTEKKIVFHLQKGLSRKEIAHTMNVSPHTINSHMKNIYRKLNINKVSDLKLV